MKSKNKNPKETLSKMSTTRKMPGILRVPARTRRSASSWTWELIFVIFVSSATWDVAFQFHHDAAPTRQAPAG
jgi:hypothetical protein